MIVTCMVTKEITVKGFGTFKPFHREVHLPLQDISSEDAPRSFTRTGNIAMDDGLIVSDPLIGGGLCPEESLYKTIQHLEKTVERIQKYTLPFPEVLSLEGFKYVDEILKVIYIQETTLEQADQDLKYVRDKFQKASEFVSKAHLANKHAIIAKAEKSETLKKALLKVDSTSPPELVRISKAVKSFRDLSHKNILWTTSKRWRKAVSVMTLLLNDHHSMYLAHLLRTRDHYLHPFPDVKQEAAVEEVYLQAFWSEDPTKNYHGLMKTIYFKPKNLSNEQKKMIDELYTSFLIRNIDPEVYKEVGKCWTTAIENVQLGKRREFRLFCLEEKLKLNNMTDDEMDELNWLKKCQALTRKLITKVEELDKILRHKYDSSNFEVNQHPFILSNFKHEIARIEEALQSHSDKKLSLARRLCVISPYSIPDKKKQYRDLYVHKKLDHETIYSSTLSKEEGETLKKANDVHYKDVGNVIEDIDVAPFLHVSHPGDLTENVSKKINAMSLDMVPEIKANLVDKDQSQEIDQKLHLQLKYPRDGNLWRKYGDYGKSLMESACARIRKMGYNQKKKAMLDIISACKISPSSSQSKKMLVEGDETEGDTAMVREYEKLMHIMTEDEAIFAHLLWLEEGGSEVIQYKEKWTYTEREELGSSRMKMRLIERGTYTPVEKYILLKAFESQLPVTVENMVLEYLLNRQHKAKTLSFIEQELVDNLSIPEWMRKSWDKSERDMVRLIYNKTIMKREEMWNGSGDILRHMLNDYVENKDFLEADQQKEMLFLFTSIADSEEEHKAHVHRLNTLKHIAENRSKIVEDFECAKKTVEFNLHMMQEKIEKLKKSYQTIQTETEDLVQRASPVWLWYEAQYHR